MNHEPSTGQARGDVRKSPGGEPWVATFSLLDINSSINSSQLKRLVAALSKVWRRTLGRRA